MIDDEHVWHAAGCAPFECFFGARKWNRFTVLDTAHHRLVILTVSVDAVDDQNLHYPGPPLRTVPQKAVLVQSGPLIRMFGLPSERTARAGVGVTETTTAAYSAQRFICPAFQPFLRI